MTCWQDCADLGNFSIQSDTRIHLPCPSIDSTLQIMQVLESHPLQKCDDLQASCAVMTNYDRRTRPIDFFNLVWDLLHRQQLASGYARQLEFPRFANIQKMRSRFRFCFHHGMQLLHG